ncbi:hypothetical protein Tco_1286399 [Tanacetum coccineum]
MILSSQKASLKTGSPLESHAAAVLCALQTARTTNLHLRTLRTSGANQGGSMTYNDQPYSKFLRAGMIGFVTQDDILFPYLTMKETITHAALLRLPKTCINKTRERKKTAYIIHELGLERNGLWNNGRRTITSVPLLWINKKWREGFHVTSVATAGTRWGIAMSRNAGFSDQVVELDFLYPSEDIHRRWDNGYRITSIAVICDQTALILSVPRRKPGDEMQETLRTSQFPSTHIKEKWAKNLYPACICYGSTCVLDSCGGRSGGAVVVVAVMAWRWSCWSWGRGGSGVAVKMIGGVGWGGGDDNDGRMQLGWWRRVFRWRRWLLVVSVVMAAVVCDDGGVVVVVRGMVMMMTVVAGCGCRRGVEARGDEWIWGSGRSGHEEHF